MLVKTIINGEIVVVERPDLPIEEEPFYTPEPTLEEQLADLTDLVGILSEVILHD